MSKGHFKYRTNWIGISTHNKNRKLNESLTYKCFLKIHSENFKEIIIEIKKYHDVILI